MAFPIPTAEDIRNIVREELQVALARSPRGGGAKELLSKRAAAKLLGIDRSTTLEALIRAGRIRTVEVGGRARVPRAELERVLATGVEPVPEPPRRAPRPRRVEPTTDDPEVLRRLDLDAL